MNDPQTPPTGSSEARPLETELLALGLGKTKLLVEMDDEEDEALERFLCALPDLELHGCLGQGGMGRVYRARQIRLDRFVAVKLMNAELGDDPEFRERFEREARALARLDHPGVVRVHDFGEAGGSFYLVMELVEGPNLRELMVEAMEPAHASGIIGQLCEALAYAHERGVIHRDIKPENVLIDADSGRVKIADFGLAKLARLDDRATTRRVVGTPQYMAPEQLRDPASVDHRADVFAIGVVFYEMLTGQLPVGRFASPSELGRGAPGLDDVVLRALESNRDARFQSAAEIAVALRSRSQDDPETKTLPDASRMQQRSRRAFAGLAVGSVAAVAGIATAMTLGSRAPENSETREETSKPVAGDVKRATSSKPASSPTVSTNRWPGSDLALLDGEITMVLGVDGSDLRQAPALASLTQNLEMLSVWDRCYADVITKTHKVIAAGAEDGSLRDIIVHGDWSPDALEPCLLAWQQPTLDPTSDGQGSATSTLEKSSFGDDGLRYRFTLNGGPKEMVVLHRGARIWMTLRENLTPEQAEVLTAGPSEPNGLAARVSRRVDLDAPIWALANPFPQAWEASVAAASLHLDLWERIEIDAKLDFRNEADAARAATLLRGWEVLMEDSEGGEQLDISIGQQGKQLSLGGWFFLPEDLGESSLNFGSGDDESGLQVSFGNSQERG